jgi:hypothetical protein
VAGEGGQDHRLHQGAPRCIRHAGPAGVLVRDEAPTQPDIGTGLSAPCPLTTLGCNHRDAMSGCDRRTVVNDCFIR